MEGGRARSAHPGHWPLACGECGLDVFRERNVNEGPNFRLYVNDTGRLFGEVPDGSLREVEAPIVCVGCEERETGGPA